MWTAVISKNLWKNKIDPYPKNEIDDGITDMSAILYCLKMNDLCEKHFFCAIGIHYIQPEYMALKKYACIEKSIITRTLSHTDSKYGSHSHSWNDEDHAFRYQLYQWGAEKLFQNQDELIIR